MLETKELILKKGSLSDWEDMYRGVWSRPECCRYMFWDLTGSEEEARDRMARTVRFQASHDAWLIFEKKSGRAIGFAGVSAESPELAREQGICLAPEYHRRGFGTQVLRALMAYAKNEGGAKRFLCTARRENTASRRLIEKECFCFVGEEEIMDHRDGTPRVLAVYEKELTDRASADPDPMLQTGGKQRDL